MAAIAILLYTRGGRESSIEDIIAVREQLCIKIFFFFIEMKFIHLIFYQNKDHMKGN